MSIFSKSKAVQIDSLLHQNIADLVQNSADFS